MVKAYEAVEKTNATEERKDTAEPDTGLDAWVKNLKSKQKVDPAMEVKVTNPFLRMARKT